MNFSGKVAFVTGAGSGIGRASAAAFAKRGATVAMCDINEEAVEAAAEELRKAGQIAHAFALDVTDTSAIERVVAEIVSRFGRLDFAHNNAGIEDAMLPFADGDEANFDRVIATDLKSVWACMKFQIRQMLLQGGGAIVNTSSVAGFTGVPGNAAYCAAKHGVIGLSRVAALEYAAQGIRVNAVCPGLTRTGIVERLSATMPDAVNAVLPPMQRMADPSEIAEAVVFLCSDHASFMTGQPITVDGGWTIM